MFAHYILILLNDVIHLNRLSSAQHCMSQPAKGCSSYTILDLLHRGGQKKSEFVKGHLKDPFCQKMILKIPKIFFAFHFQIIYSLPW